jgi:pimeloyl-ACP methyl ester carboxylesterase
MRFFLPLFLLLFACTSYANGKLQKEFDYLGPTMKTMQSSSGRTVVYLDEGDENWQTVVFVGGSGTSGRVFALLEFLRETRQNLKLRFIGVERNGFGSTGFDDSLGYEDYAEDVESLLDVIGVGEFSLFAISGGGPYSARIAARNSDRLISVHLAAALTFEDPAALQCQVPAAALTVYTQDPVAWFGFAPESPIHRIPGFQDAAFDDAARTFNLGGQAGDPAALHHEFQLYCLEQFLPDLSPITAPVYLYYGDADPLTPIKPHAGRWQAAYSNAEVTSRFYLGEGHDAQYRHLDQILVDMAGMGGRLVVCNTRGRTKLVKEPKAEKILAAGGSLGLCAWRD